jgi:tetratricopeptide (TPR) repeat protein
MQYNYHVEAKAAVEPIFDLAIEKNSKKRLSQIYTIMGTYAYMVDEDIPKASEYLERGLEISEIENDDAASFFGNHFYGLALSLDCKFDEALTCFEKALEISTKANSQWGVAAMKCMIAYFVYWAHGQVDQGYRISEEALKLANESGDIFSKALSFTTHGILSYGKGAYKDASANLMKGVELCERIDLFFWNALAQTYLGEVFYYIGEYSKAKAHYAKSISLLEDKQIIPYWVKLNKMGLIKAKVMNREPDISLSHIVTFEKNNKMKFCDGLMKRYLGEICLNMEDLRLSDADSWITGAIGTDTKNGMLHNLGLDYVLYSNLCKKKGDQSGVAESHKKALKIFSECGCSGISVC